MVQLVAQQENILKLVNYSITILSTLGRYLAFEHKVEVYTLLINYS